MTRYASTGDKIYLFLGTLFATIFGACFPAFFYFLGRVVDEVALSTSEFNYDPEYAYEASFWMSIAGGIAFISAWMQITLISWYSDGMINNLAVTYFRLCLSKDGSFYDRAKPEKVASKLKFELEVIRKIGESFAYAFQSGTAFIGSFAVAFWTGWLYTVCLIPGIPVIVSTGLLMAIALNVRARDTAKAYVQSGGLAAQAIDAIKLVHAYSNELLERRNYVRRLQDNQALLKNQVVHASLAIGGIYCLIYLFYAGAIWVGSELRVRDVSSLNSGFVYSGGQIICIMGCVILGSFDLGTVVTHIKKINEAKEAG
jgi:ATP-binding cassette subfamily B (MDR/TAP) protein 1